MSIGLTWRVSSKRTAKHSPKIYYDRNGGRGATSGMGETSQQIDWYVETDDFSSRIPTNGDLIKARLSPRGIAESTISALCSRWSEIRRVGPTPRRITFH